MTQRSPIKRSDLLAMQKALRQRWPVTAEQWHKGAGEALAVIRDPSSYPRLIRAALGVFVEAARTDLVDVDETIRELLPDAKTPKPDTHTEDD